MITNRGKTFFKNYLANQSNQIAGSVAFGIGGTLAGVGDSRLQFEFARTPINVVTFDSINNRLVFKGTLPAETSGTIYEIGLWTSDVTSANTSDDRIITTFDSATEAWDSSTFDTVTVRIGNDSLKQTPAASASATSTLSNLNLDFIDNSSQDTFVVAFNCDNGNTASIKVRFMTDTSNYYEMTVTNPSTGYNFGTVSKSAISAIGTPDWANITALQVITTAKSTGAASVEFDGIRIEDNDTFVLDYGMIARYIPTSPVVKPQGQVLDFEYTLAVNV